MYMYSLELLYVVYTAYTREVKQNLSDITRIYPLVILGLFRYLLSLIHGNYAGLRTATFPCKSVRKRILPLANSDS